MQNQQQKQTSNEAALDRELILVLGATGNQGGSVIEHLMNLRQTSNIDIGLRALVLNPESAAVTRLRDAGVEIVRGSMEDSNSMRKALKGITRVFFHTTHNLFKGEQWEAEASRGLSVVGQLAATPSLRQVIYSALPAIEGYQEGAGKVLIEAEMRKRGLPLTTVLSPFYLENFIAIWPPIRRWSGLAGQLQWGWFPTDLPLRMPHGSVKDFGAVVARILLLPVEQYLNRHVTVVSEDLTLSEVLDRIGKGIGETIKYQPISRRVFCKLPFHKEVLSALEFYADNMSDFQKVEESLLLTDGTGARSLAEASQETRRLYANIQSIEGWAENHRQQLCSRAGSKVAISVLFFLARMRSLFTTN